MIEESGVYNAGSFSYDSFLEEEQRVAVAYVTRIGKKLERVRAELLYLVIEGKDTFNQYRVIYIGDWRLNKRTKCLTSRWVRRTFRDYPLSIRLRYTKLTHQKLLVNRMPSKT